MNRIATLLFCALATLTSTGCATSRNYHAPRGHTHIAGFELYGYGSARMPGCVTLPGKWLVVFRDYQHLVAYEHGCVASRSSIVLESHVSTGMIGHETPITNPARGPHRIEYTEMHYRSKTYPEPHGGAPMPYAMFFDRAGGFALHGGERYRSKRMRGKPFGMSHGCVRLDQNLARIIFEQFQDETLRVVVTENTATFMRDWVQSSAATR